MHKPNPGRMGALLALAASLGFGPEQVKSTAQVMQKHRGKAPKGKKWVSGIYIPAGRYRNVDDTVIRNPKVAAHVQMMHEKWREQFDARQAARHAE